MPLYDYKCPDCKKTLEVFQPMSGSHEGVPCACGGTALRVWRVPGAIVDNGETYFNAGLGKVVRTKGDVRDAVKRVNDETGQSLVEIGNEKVKPKPTYQRYPTASELGY